VKFISKLSKHNRKNEGMRNLFYLKNKKNHFYGQDLGLNWQTIIAKSKKLILNNWNGNPSFSLISIY
jgi:hypothetical protein